MTNFPVLSLLIFFVPLVGILSILAIRGDADVVARNARYVALWTSMINFLLSLFVWVNFDSSTAKFQFVEESQWMPAFGINYKVGVDGISMFFVLLSTLLTPVCVLASWESIQARIKEYMISFLIMEAFMIGMFCALDMVVFYVFFEAVLIPMFVIIGVWGGPRRVYAAFKFFLYTLAGSVLM
ncbi:MAG: complex I subunit 4 family protein, partial [Rhodospirillales bacterium]